MLHGDPLVNRTKGYPGMPCTEPACDEPAEIKGRCRPHHQEAVARRPSRIDPPIPQHNAPGVGPERVAELREAGEAEVLRRVNEFLQKKEEGTQ